MLSLFLARRFFRGGGRASKPAVAIATAGIAVALAVMLVSVSVVRGFQAEVTDKLTGFASHIEVVGTGAFTSPEASPIVTDEALVKRVAATPGVVHCQRIAEKIGVLKTHDDFSAILLKGIAEDYDTAFVARHIVEGQLPKFSATKSTGKIVVSRLMANKLGLHVGDKIFTYFFEENIKQRRLEVAAVYDTHMHQFDNAFALTDLYTVQRLNAWAPSQTSGLEVRLDNMEQLDAAQRQLASWLNSHKDTYGNAYHAVSVKENPRTASVLSWLELLDTNVLVILALMTAVAGITMVSGLLILILERISTIGLLKAMGARGATVRHTFLWYAALIVMRGMAWGNALGLGLVALQRFTGCVTLNPETYYVEAVPVDISLPLIVLLNAVTLLVTMLALLVPSFMASRVEPAKAIRFE